MSYGSIKNQRWDTSEKGHVLGVHLFRGHEINIAIPRAYRRIFVTEFTD
jgi:hypothetical protein